MKATAVFGNRGESAPNFFFDVSVFVKQHDAHTYVYVRIGARRFWGPGRKYEKYPYWKCQTTGYRFVTSEWFLFPIPEGAKATMWYSSLSPAKVIPMKNEEAIRAGLVPKEYKSDPFDYMFIPMLATPQDIECMFVLHHQTWNPFLSGYRQNMDWELGCVAPNGHSVILFVWRETSNDLAPLHPNVWKRREFVHPDFEYPFDFSKETLNFDLVSQVLLNLGSDVPKENQMHHS